MGRQRKSNLLKVADCICEHDEDYCAGMAHELAIKILKVLKLKRT
jgi:hypothetical protein